MPKSEKKEWSLDQQEFIHLTAYELRIRTQEILGILEMLKSFPEKSAEYLPKIEKNVRRLHKSIQDMIDPTNENKFVIKKEKINLVDEITNLVKEYTDSANERSVKIKFVFDENETFYVYGHRTRLYQVFVNLIANCLKFTKDGSIDVSLSKYSNNTIDKEAYARISIHDTGSSIDPEILPRLFNRPSEPPDGTGFALFISKHILNAHGGSISAYNNADNKGATFVVTLPLPDAQELDDDSRALHSEPNAP
jgi:signal transduction histidine kinase